jgi:hypothetical protein
VYSVVVSSYTLNSTDCTVHTVHTVDKQYGTEVSGKILPETKEE